MGEAGGQSPHKPQSERDMLCSSSSFSVPVSLTPLSSRATSFLFPHAPLKSRTQGRLRAARQQLQATAAHEHGARAGGDHARGAPAPRLLVRHRARRADAHGRHVHRLRRHPRAARCGRRGWSGRRGRGRRGSGDNGDRSRGGATAGPCYCLYFQRQDCVWEVSLRTITGLALRGVRCPRLMRMVCASHRRGSRFEVGWSIRCKKVGTTPGAAQILRPSLSLLFHRILPSRRRRSVAPTTKKPVARTATRRLPIMAHMAMTDAEFDGAVELPPKIQIVSALSNTMEWANAVAARFSALTPQTLSCLHS